MDRKEHCVIAGHSVRVHQVLARCFRAVTEIPMIRKRRHGAVGRRSREAYGYARAC